MGNDVPRWVEDATLKWSPERPFTPAARSAPGPWSAPIVDVEPQVHTAFALWRLGIGAGQGVFFYLLFHSRSVGVGPGANPYLFDALALAGLFAPLLALEAIGYVTTRWLAPVGAGVALLLAALGWYHRWRIFGMDQNHIGISLLVLCATALFIVQVFLQAREKSSDDRGVYADLFAASWTLAARLVFWALAMGAALILLNSPWAPHTHLEEGDLLAMPLLGLVSALAFQCTAAIPRFTLALKDALVASVTILLPFVCAAALFLISAALGQGPAPLTYLLFTMLALTVAINASYRGGPSSTYPRKAWRDGTECFGAFLLLILAGLGAWALNLRVGAFGWTATRIFAGVAVAFFLCYGLGYSAAAIRGLAAKGWMRWLEKVNIICGLGLAMTCIALASPLADPMRLAVAAQTARLNDGRVNVGAFDFLNLRRDGGRFGAAALDALAQGPFPDIARTAALTRDTDPVAITPNPTEIGANIAVRTLGANLPATLLTRDWRNVAGIPACLTRATEICDAYFMDMDGDGQDEILLVSGSETNWWGVVMKADAAGRWFLAGRIAAPSCGVGMADLRAGRFSLVAPPPGFRDLSVAGVRLSVNPVSSGCPLRTNAR